MQLFEKIKEDRMTARKDHDRAVSSVLTTLVGELESQSKRTGLEITNDLVIQTCKKFIFNNTETMKLIISETKYDDLADENNALEKYLPMQLTNDQITSIINTLAVKNLKVIMQHFKDNYPGQFDGKNVATISKEFV